MNIPIAQLLESSSKLSVDRPSNKYFKEYLESCFEQAAFYSKDDESATIKYLNKSINSPGNKQNWLLVLLTLFPRISVEALQDNSIFWMLSCKKLLGVHSEVEGLAFKVLGTLINLTAKLPEVNKEAAKQLIPQILVDTIRRKSNTAISLEFLHCLQAILNNYSGPAAEFKADIIKVILSTVESSPDIVKAAAKCVPLVAKLGGGGKLGITHKTSWHRQQLALVDMLHLLLDNIYEYVNIEHVRSEQEVSDALFTLESFYEEDVHRRIQCHARRFVSVSQFLLSMLLEEYPVGKMVDPDRILDVIVHAQKPTHSSLGTVRESLAVKSVLPAIQVATLRLLEGLIISLGRHLVPSGALISYLLSQVITWTQQQCTNWPYAVEKPYKKTRCAAYCCLCSWLSVNGAASQVELLLEKSLTTILSDVHTKKPSVKLNVGSKTKKGKKAQQVLKTLDNPSEQLGNNKANSDVCVRALEALTLLVRSTSTTTMKLNTYKSIVETVTTLASELPVPYSVVSCHCALYRLMLVMCTEPHPKATPPLASALKLFSDGVLHPDSEVREVCSSGVSCLEKILHPICTTLYFPHLQEKLIFDDEQLQDHKKGLFTKKRKHSSEESDNNSDVFMVDGESNYEKESDVLVSSSSVHLSDHNNEVHNSSKNLDRESCTDAKTPLDPIQHEVDCRKYQDCSSESKSLGSEVEEKMEVCDDPTEEQGHLGSTAIVTDNSNELVDDSSKNKCKNSDVHSSIETENKSIETEIKSIETEIQSCDAASPINEADADVSQMLLDFHDDVNDGSQ